MVEVVVFHHAHGLTDGVRAFAEELRAAGHSVHTPDMFEGHVFDLLDDGLAFARETGFAEVCARGVRAAEALPPAVVHIGFSMGAMPAQQLAQTRAGARGAVLLHACLPASEHGSWPAGVPVQVHGMDADPFFTDDGDIDAAHALVQEASDAELFLYQGDQHLFTDPTLAAHDADAAALVRERVLALLGRC